MRISKLSWIEILNNHEEFFDLHKMEAFSKFIQMKLHITVDPRDPFIAFLCIEDTILKERMKASKKTSRCHYEATLHNLRRINFI